MKGRLDKDSLTKIAHQGEKYVGKEFTRYRNNFHVKFCRNCYNFGDSTDACLNITACENCCSDKHEEDECTRAKIPNLT